MSEAALLEVNDVVVRFGGFAAVNGVSLRVPTHGTVGLVGPNGAGKTTLFNAVTGLQSIGAGSVRFAGDDISRLSPVRRARMGIGRSFQNLGLLREETVRTNVLAAQFLGAGYRGWDPLLRPWRWRRTERSLGDRAEQWLDRFELMANLDTPVKDLSFAGSRFVELCGILARNPQLMLLDEPTTGLSQGECDVLASALADVHQSGVTILVISHDVRFVMANTRYVYVLDFGEVLAEGLPDEVRQNPAVISAYLGTRAARQAETGA